MKDQESPVEYPDGALGTQLRRAAQLLATDLGVRVLFASQDGYDTHAGQSQAHGNLLGTLSDSLAAFQKDLAARSLADRVLVLVFSEFGRRVDENASRGTDHGAASSLFLVGRSVKGGLAGSYPSLEKTRRRRPDLQHRLPLGLRHGPRPLDGLPVRAAARAGVSRCSTRSDRSRSARIKANETYSPRKIRRRNNRHFQILNDQTARKHYLSDLKHI